MSNVIDFNSKKNSKNELVDALEVRCQCGNNKYKLLILVENTKLVMECTECGTATDFDVLFSQLEQVSGNNENDGPI
jgi:hypothetical protein